MGERLIILAERSKLTNGGAGNVSDCTLAECLSARNKLLISTPTYPAAAKYKALAVPPMVAQLGMVAAKRLAPALLLNK